MSTNILDQIHKFSQDNPKIYTEILDMFGIEIPLCIFANVSEHTRLFNVFKRSASRKFSSVVRALDNMDQADDDHVLIFIGELQIYGLFTIDEYIEFMKQLSDKAEEGLQSTPHQVVPTDKKQKLVFICAADDKTILSKISKYVKDCLSADVKTTENSQKTEITVDKISVTSRDDMFNELFTYISQRDKSIADLLSPLKMIRVGGYKYTIPKLDISVHTTEALLAILKTGRTVNTGAVGANNGGPNIINNAAMLGTNEAREWIRNNPPNSEKTGDYYIKYKVAAKNPLQIQKFAKLMTQTGYTQSRSGSFNIWKKPQ